MDPNDWTLTGNSIDPTNFLGTTNNEPLIIKTNGTEQLRIDPAGKVGIGITSPAQKLHVDGNIIVNSTTNLNDDNVAIKSSGPGFGVSVMGTLSGRNAIGGIRQSPTGNGGLFFLRESSGGPDTISLDADGNSYLNAGNVGIGTESPQARLDVVGNIHATGTKNFVQAHPTDPTKEIVYATLEGGEAGTYTRGTWKLDNGKALIKLPEHFGLVTSEDGLTVQFTPRGEWLQLYVVQVNTQELVVRETQGKSGQFDYLIQGVRKGYEHHEVIQERK